MSWLEERQLLDLAPGTVIEFNCPHPPAGCGRA